MGNKGQKTSNIIQKLKADVAWSSKDGSKPIIKDVGIKSPLNMKLNQLINLVMVFLIEVLQ